MRDGIGFTGTQRGMTDQQSQAVMRILILDRDRKDLKVDKHGFASIDRGVVHHGDCIGADAEFHRLARRRRFQVILHPSILTGKRAFCDWDELRHAIEPLKRNHDIVDESTLMIGAPGEGGEVLRSGTWATLRYAKKTGVPMKIVYPDGRVDDSF